MYVCPEKSIEIQWNFNEKASLKTATTLWLPISEYPKFSLTMYHLFNYGHHPITPNFCLPLDEL